VKDVDAYSIVGKSVPRVDLPAKATGELVFTFTTSACPACCTARRAPALRRRRCRRFVGTSLIAVDEASVRDIPGLIAVVRIGDFVGVVAEREENAIKARRS